jgi:hypothetical protein
MSFLLYSIFKIEFGFEKYLSKLSVKNKINLSKFRCSNMKFPIETGGWQNIARKIGKNIAKTSIIKN